ncbi:hypothetical protein BDR04DRAFT_1117985 [Suillus decipiens]|nr:hypothetical protein BDR04DRAFT_1117985 [Suillus decipiens]
MKDVWQYYKLITLADAEVHKLLEDSGCITQTSVLIGNWISNYSSLGVLGPDRINLVLKGCTPGMFPYEMIVFHTSAIKCTWFSCHYSPLESGKLHFATLKVPWFSKCLRMIGDFGLNMNLLDKDDMANAVITTGTFPFNNMADSNKVPHITHDLELYIFLLWVIGINFKGP